MCPDAGGPIAQNALDHSKVAAGFHRAASLNDAAYPYAPHGPDGKSGLYVALDVDISQKLNISRGKVHIFRDIQHRLDLKAAAGKLHMT